MQRRSIATCAPGLAREAARSRNHQLVASQKDENDLPEFAEDGASDGFVEISIVEDDQRRVPAELHRELLERRGRLLHEDLADARRSSEGNFVHLRERSARDKVGKTGEAHMGVLAQLPPDILYVLLREDHINDAVGHTSLTSELDDGED